MSAARQTGASAHPPPVYVVSGGSGASGEQVVHTVLAQFPDSQVPVVTFAHVRDQAQIAPIVAQAAAAGAIVVHTLVDSALRAALIAGAQEQGVAHVDLMGDLISRLSDVLGREPLAHPGLYRELHRAYFDRVSAIEFSMAHDDGLKAQDWPQAEIVLTGVSRVGKTPLSMYLAVLGWKVANVPLVPGVPPPPELFQLDARRVFGLTMEPGQLLFHRKRRQRHLIAPGLDDYVDPERIAQELDMAREVFRRGGFTVIDVTDKPIETTADQILDRIARRFADKPYGRPI